MSDTLVMGDGTPVQRLTRDLKQAAREFWWRKRGDREHEAW